MNILNHKSYRSIIQDEVVFEYAFLQVPNINIYHNCNEKMFRNIKRSSYQCQKTTGCNRAVLPKRLVCRVGSAVVKKHICSDAIGSICCTCPPQWRFDFSIFLLDICSMPPYSFHSWRDVNKMKGCEQEVVNAYCWMTRFSIFFSIATSVTGLKWWHWLPWRSLVKA